jgi:hypothetical protein
MNKEQIILALSELLNHQPTKPKLVGPDEAARILNIPVTKSRTHTRRLAWYRQHGYLKKFTGQKPFYYNVNELESLSRQIAEGQVVIPTLVS